MTANKKIVIVDDEPDIRELLKYNLTRDGYQVELFPNPVEAIDYLKDKTPDMILSDWLMPKMDGLEFCRYIKTDGHLKNVPLIMISCKGEEKDKQAAINTGANDYLVKPFRIKDLIDCLNTYNV